VRVGAVTRERLAEIAGAPLPERTRGEIAAPGTLEQHYAPAARVIVADAVALPEGVGSRIERGERVGLLALHPPREVPSGLVVLRPPSDVEEYAHVLYDRLREADALGLDALVVVVPPEVGLGAAIADRVRRAAGASR
jgi:L-threonylcarbamoyladenylate synthase